MFRTDCRVLCVSLVLCGLFAGAAHAQTLVWADEFDGSTIDATNWEHMIGDGTLYGLPAGWGNNELQFYTDSPNNSFVSGGYLHIVALEEAVGGYNYTSARLRTKNKQDFLYGRIEASIKLPTTRSMWPALWMMPTAEVYGTWAASGEIDIMEAKVSTFPKQIVGSIHYGGEWPDNLSQSYYYSEGNGPNATDFSQDFHTYAVEWEPTVIRWYVDGNLYGTATNWSSTGGPFPAPFDQAFHFIVNIAIGGSAPAPNSSTTLPQEMLVDYIRVYEIELTCGNGACDNGEDCNSCPDDCVGQAGGPPSGRYCCGDGTCESPEDAANCAVDCQGGPVCGDGTCDPGEDACSCAADCGSPPASETNCADGVDEDCDGDSDCDDSDCTATCFPNCGNGVCDPGEDCSSCQQDCDGQTGGRPSGRYCCGNGEFEGPEGDGRCDGNP